MELGSQDDPSDMELGSQDDHSDMEFGNQDNPIDMELGCQDDPSVLVILLTFLCILLLARQMEASRPQWDLNSSHLKWWNPLVDKKKAGSSQIHTYQCGHLHM